MVKKAKQSDWKNEPMPSLNREIVVNRSFSERELVNMMLGSIPEVMEDKWFIYLERGQIFVHCAWTGHCIFVADFVEDSGLMKISKATVNRDPDQYWQTDDDIDRQLLSCLIDLLLLRRPCKFPTFDEHSEKNTLALWHHFGRAMNGEVPDMIGLSEKSRE